MARTKKIKEVAVAAEETVAVPAKTGAATVEWRGNSRSYSSAVHGEAYLQLAQEFAEKVGGTVVV